MEMKDGGDDEPEFGAGQSQSIHRTYSMQLEGGFGHLRPMLAASATYRMCKNDFKSSD